MSIFKCKMCGGTIEFEQGASIGTCDSCGSVQTLPKGNDEAITNLFNRANNLRIKAEFDKAGEIYEKIVDEDNTNAEAHWGIVLCKYGIEYVEDPSTYKRVPTCHRAQYESIMTDADYLAALENSDTTQQGIYTQQALEISNIQKGILAIVKDEKPFDVFICYKETDANGKRTIDSALANDIYYQLTQEGLKVFYAAITLEDKLGQEYEPYIFAALNSARVMLVVGTKPEYFEAVWVKNEWSRFLKIMKNDRSRLLIPCYRDMDAYDLPEDFAHLQAQDMSKIGFVNDVVRGIKKVIDGSQPKAQVVKETTVINNGGNGSNTDALLERAFIFLEDGKWQDANIYCEKVLDIDPKNAEAYLGKLMAELQVRNRKKLADCAEPFDGRNNYSKVLRFGNEKITGELKDYISRINKRNIAAHLAGTLRQVIVIYNDAKYAMSVANSENTYKGAAESFKSISSFIDADVLAEQCLEKAEICRKDVIYDLAKSEMAKDTTSDYKSAISKFESIIDWKDSKNKINECNEGIEKLRIAEEKAEAECKRKAEEARVAAEAAKAKKKKKKMIISTIVAVIIVFLIVLNSVILPASNYKKAISLLNDGEIVEAYESLVALNGYKDSATKANEIFVQYKTEKMKIATVGDIVCFGAYEQDNNTSNGKEDIEWRVLAKENNRILVISEYALDCQQYNTSYTDVTWETCTLRKWMNNDFLNAAFSAEEQKQIQSAKVTADANPNYSTNPGNDTTDKVFLLSINEVNKYFSSDDDRMCVPTAYAISNGAYTGLSFRRACWWWLRSPGHTSLIAAFVYTDGFVYYNGYDVNCSDGCVRPALWIEI